ncbi:hypothetical protein VCHC17A1_4097A, partial [Vibrio cholerae HC-17A1]
MILNSILVQSCS